MKTKQLSTGWEEVELGETKAEKIISKIFPENINIDILPNGYTKGRRHHSMCFDKKDKLIILEDREKDGNGEIIRIGIKTKKNNEICIRLRKCHGNGNPHVNINFLYNGHQLNKDRFKKYIFPIKFSHEISPLPSFVRIIVKQKGKIVYDKNIETIIIK